MGSCMDFLGNLVKKRNKQYQKKAINMYKKKIKSYSRKTKKGKCWVKSHYRSTPFIQKTMRGQLIKPVLLKQKTKHSPYYHFISEGLEAE